MPYSVSRVSRAVLNLKANLSARPDDLPPLLFKRLRFSIAKPLVILYTQLFSVEFVPESWNKWFCYGSRRGTARRACQ